MKLIERKDIILYTVQVTDQERRVIRNALLDFAKVAVNDTRSVANALAREFDNIEELGKEDRGK